jgi:aspartate aminotransferase
MRWPAERMGSQQAKSFGISEQALQRQAAGADIIHLAIGRPSDDTPNSIKMAAKRALDDGIVHYGDLQGERSLREALAARYRTEQNLPCGPENILVTTGATQAAFAACMASLNPGDEAIVLQPFYPQHNSKIEFAGAHVRLADLQLRNGRFSIDPDAVERAITASTKMLVLVNPANPTGTVFTLQELEALSRICIRHDVLVLADEVYEYVVYDGRKHISIAALPGMWERTITVSALTKAYAMDGWRIGYAVAPASMIRQLQLVTSTSTTHPCVFAQVGGHYAVTDASGQRAQLVAEDLRRRDLVVRRLNEIHTIDYAAPEGTIFAFVDIRGFGLSSAAMAQEILLQANVAVEPGSFYGPAGEGYLRICFGSEPYVRIETAMDRISNLLASRSLG